MRYLLAELLEGSPLYEVRRDGDGFMFVGHPDRLKEFSQIVRRAQDKAGDEYLVFPTSAPRRLYRCLSSPSAKRRYRTRRARSD